MKKCFRLKKRSIFLKREWWNKDQVDNVQMLSDVEHDLDLGHEGGQVVAVHRWVGHLHGHGDKLVALTDPNCFSKKLFEKVCLCFLKEQVSISSTFYIQIFHSARCFGSFCYEHVTREKLPKQRLYEKFIRKMLMKWLQVALSEHIYSIKNDPIL